LRKTVLFDVEKYRRTDNFGYTAQLVIVPLFVPPSSFLLLVKLLKDASYNIRLFFLQNKVQEFWKSFIWGRGDAMGA